jgi:hypothetical protein
MERGEFAPDGHSEDCARTDVVSTLIRYAVEISVAAQHYAPRVVPIGAMGLGAKAVERAQFTGRRHSKNNAAAILSASISRPVVIAVCGLNHGPVVWIFTVPAIEGREIRKSLRSSAQRQAEGDGRGHGELMEKLHGLHFILSVVGNIDNRCGGAQGTWGPR